MVTLSDAPNPPLHLYFDAGLLPPRYHYTDYSRVFTSAELAYLPPQNWVMEQRQRQQQQQQQKQRWLDQQRRQQQPFGAKATVRAGGGQEIIRQFLYVIPGIFPEKREGEFIPGSNRRKEARGEQSGRRSGCENGTGGGAAPRGEQSAAGGMRCPSCEYGAGVGAVSRGE